MISSEDKYHEKMELSQLMKDMLHVTEEENVLFEDDVDAKYDALGTKLSLVKKGSKEWNNLLTHISEHEDSEDHANFKSDGDKFDPNKTCSKVPEKVHFD